MVIKEETHTREEWTSIKDVKKVPSEVKVMSKLNKIHCYAIPRLFNYKRYPHVYKHRMYMEYCSFNDLAVLCKRYTRFRLVTDDVPVVRFIDQSVDRQYLPEPFLWDTFYHLVEAAVVMRVGLKDDERDLEIVHRDIKPNNSKAFHTQLFHNPDNYSSSLSLSSKGEREERISFLPCCQTR